MTHDFAFSGPRAALRLGVLGALMALSACGGGKSNTSVESVHQPVVSYTSFVYDVRTQGGSGLSDGEADRLDGWLVSLNAGYGDKVALVTEGPAIPYGMQQDIAALLGRRSLTLGENAGTATGAPMPGFVRLVLRRAAATVPGCPDWSHNQESNMVGGSSSNFGCGVNGNLAAMVANPEDLVRGVSSSSDMQVSTSSKAIESYRKQEPTGASGLKSLSASGGN